MDFNEINKINVDFNSTPKKSKGVEKKSVEKELKQFSTKKSPSNPSYWQNAAGVKISRTSFKGNREEVSDEYLKQKIEYLTIVMESNDNLGVATPTFRTEINSLAPYGKDAVDNYAKLLGQSTSYFIRNEKLKKYSQVASSLVKNLPDMTDENIKDLSYILFSALSNNESKADKYLNIIQAISPKKDVSTDDKVIWLRKNLEDSHINSKDGTEHPFFSSYDTIFNADAGLFPFFESNEEKQDLLKCNLSPEYSDKLGKLFANTAIEQGRFKATISHILKFANQYEKEKEQFIKFLDTISDDETKIPTINRLISGSTFVYYLSSLQLNQFLATDEKFLNKFLDKLELKNKESKSTFLVQNPHDFQEFLEHINDDNLQDFLDATNGKEAQESIYYAGPYINPITKLFDKSLIDREDELNNAGIDKFNIKKIVSTSIDRETGKLSPIAKELIDFLFPQQEEDSLCGKFKKFKNSIKQKSIAHSSVYVFSVNGEIIDLLNSLKDKNGSFKEENLKYLFKLIRANRKENNYRNIPLDELASIMTSIKNENGIVDRNKMNIAVKIIKKTHSYEDTAKAISSLKNFPSDKCNHIFDICSSIGQKEAIIMENFANYVKFLFDENGNLKQENYDYLLKLVSKNEIQYDSSFFDMLEDKPYLKEFILELVPSINSYNGSQFIVSEISNFDSNEEPISENVKDRMINYVVANKGLHCFTSLYNACFKDGVFDEELFEKSLKLLSLERNLEGYYNFINGSLCVDIVNQEVSPTEIKFKNKVHIIDSLRKVREQVKNDNLTGFEYLDKAISDIEASLSLENVGLPISNEVRLDFIKNVLSSTSSKTELTEFENVMANSIPLLEEMNDGVPLSYSREKFLKDLSRICSTPEDIDILKKKTDITPILTKEEDKQIITGYDGIIKLNELDLNNAKEKQIYDCMNRFLYDNSVISSNKQLNKNLNYVIKACPEFINCIGKKQHGTHKYTVDVHSLLLMAYSIQNPSYKEKLNALDKSLLKFSAIFHDVMKQEGVVDKGHQHLSSLYAKSISKKIFSSPEIQDRLFELIDNHHWSEEYSNAVDKKEKAQELAFRFRRPNDFEIAKIMARADLKAVNENFYLQHENCLDEENLKPITRNINKLYATGNALFSNKIIAPKKIPRVIHPKDGKEYAVINLNEITKDTDMGNYGFTKGLKKDDLIFLVHMVDSSSVYTSLNTLKLLTSPINGGVLSESIITPEYNRTYCGREYGVLLSQINTNIINESELNQGSGYAKDFSDVMNLIFSDYSNYARNNFKNSLLNILEIQPDSVSEEEYAIFYKENLASKTSIREINLNKEYKIGQYSVSGTKLVEAIKTYQNSLIDKKENSHNEIVGYAPKINAVIAKVQKFEEVPDELLKFADENKLPIILM